MKIEFSIQIFEKIQI